MTVAKLKFDTGNIFKIEIRQTLMVQSGPLLLEQASVTGRLCLTVACEIIENA